MHILSNSQRTMPRETKMASYELQPLGTFKIRSRLDNCARITQQSNNTKPKLEYNNPTPLLNADHYLKYDPNLTPIPDNRPSKKS